MSYDDAMCHSGDALNGMLTNVLPKTNPKINFLFGSGEAEASQKLESVKPCETMAKVVSNCLHVLAIS